MKLTKLEKAVIKWWEGRRPLDFDLEEHLKSPEINRSSDCDKELAKFAADIVRKRVDK